MYHPDRKSLKLLKRLYKIQEPCTVEDCRELRILNILKYTEPELKDDDYYGTCFTGRHQISDLGVTYMIWRRSELIRNWLPYILTTLISIIALVISIVSAQ